MKRMRLIDLPVDFFDYSNNIEILDLSQNDILFLDDKIFSSLKRLLVSEFLFDGFLNTT